MLLILDTHFIFTLFILHVILLLVSYFIVTCLENVVKLHLLAFTQKHFMVMSVI